MALPSAPTPPAAAGRLATGRGEDYNTGLTALDVEKAATEDGQAGVLDPALVGQNSHMHAGDLLVGGHEAATSVIGHQLRYGVLGVVDRLNAEQPWVDAAGRRALAAIAEFLSAGRRLALHEARMLAAGLPLPTRKDFLVLAASLLALFVGDWALIAMGFQLFGLSDTPWIPGIGFTDDLHLAAVSSVAFLVVLGDKAGDQLRRIQHPLELRRKAPKAARSQLPWPAPFDGFWLLVCLGVGVTGLYALSAIRASYLVDLGVDPNSAAFFWIQAAIFTAAVALGYAHANPDAKMYRSLKAKHEVADAGMGGAVTEYVDSVGSFNAGIDQLDAIVAAAGHHVDADGANTDGQLARYKRRYLLAQLEPAQDALFGEGAHELTRQYRDGELLARLAGVTALPRFTKLSASTVLGAQATAVEKLSALRARLDQREIDALGLPDLEEPEPAAQPATERPDVEDGETEGAPATPLRRVPRPADKAGDDGEAMA